MSKVCELTGKRKLRGNKVSHANNKTPFFQNPNLQSRTFAVPELGLRVRLKVSTSAIRLVTKYGGLSRYIVKNDAEALPSKLRGIRKALLAKGLH